MHESFRFRVEISNTIMLVYTDIIIIKEKSLGTEIIFKIINNQCCAGPGQWPAWHSLCQAVSLVVDNRAVLRSCLRERRLWWLHGRESLRASRQHPIINRNGYINSKVWSSAVSTEFELKSHYQFRSSKAVFRKL